MALFLAVNRRRLMRHAVAVVCCAAVLPEFFFIAGSWSNLFSYESQKVIFNFEADLFDVPSSRVCAAYNARKQTINWIGRQRPC